MIKNIELVSLEKLSSDTVLRNKISSKLVDFINRNNLDINKDIDKIIDKYISILGDLNIDLHHEIDRGYRLVNVVEKK